MLEVAHRGHHRGCRDRSHAQQLLGLAHLIAGLAVCGDALVAPSQVCIEFLPLRIGPLQRQPGQSAQFIAGIFHRVGKHLAQRLGALGEHQSELRQQAPDAVDAGGAVCLDALSQAVDAQHALLLHALDRHEVHVRARGRLADRSGIVGVVLAALALEAIRHDVRGGNDAGIQPQSKQLARPVMGAGAGLHGNQAARGQLRAPSQEFIACQGAPGDAQARGIDRKDLDHALCQIHADSGNLVHGASPFKGFRLTSQINLGTRCRDQKARSPFAFISLREAPSVLRPQSAVVGLFDQRPHCPTLMSMGCLAQRN
ncbi:hypothetical protein D9M72_478470 [compost metagenome]